MRADRSLINTISPVRHIANAYNRYMHASPIDSNACHATHCTQKPSGSRSHIAYHRDEPPCREAATRVSRLIGAESYPVGHSSGLHKSTPRQRRGNYVTGADKAGLPADLCERDRDE